MTKWAIYIYIYIYIHKELQLRKTTAVNKLSYLDSMIEIEDSCFWTDVYNKRNGFGFHIVNFPNLSSNIPLSPAYGYISLNW